MKNFFLSLIVFISLLNSLYAYSASDAEKLRKIMQHFFTPIEHDSEFLTKQAAKIKLGRTLFFDPRLSSDDERSCNSCHDLSRYGTNGDLFLALKKQDKTFRDVPSIYNKSDFLLFNWIGNKHKLTDKIQESLTSQYEMGEQNNVNIVQRIAAIKGYHPLFQQAYPNDKNTVTLANIETAIATFMKGLITPAPIDKFIAGNNNALTPEQVSGGLMFDKRYCHSCHTGTNLGGKMIQKVGIKEPWPNQEDLGYFYDTKQSSHKMFFRVSPLRNIEKTAPYFHDGSSKRMWHAVKKMGRYELGSDIAMPDALSIQEFFRGLTGELPTQYIKAPILPR